MGPLPENALVERARSFAEKAHAGQKYGDAPFSEGHLARVVATLEAFGETDRRLLAAAWLHDTVEDTSTTIDDIRREFGDDVADLVWRLTDEAEGNRRERQARTHVKMRGRTEAVRVKLADRIANVEASIEQHSHLFGMYRKEQRALREHLCKPGEWEDMWQRLEELLARRT